MSAIRLFTDADSWRAWDTPVGSYDDGTEYGHLLAQSQQRSGVDEAIVTGTGAVNGNRVALVVSDFYFMGGSIGLVASDRLCTAIRRATAERLPLVAMPSSGGTRMYEGTAAFVQMINITNCIMAHKVAGLEYMVYLRNPTTGGVFASWGLLGHVTFAEPRALLGFLGPKVYQALNGVAFPDGVQSSENLYSHGIIDGVVTLGEFRDWVGSALQIFRGCKTNFTSLKTEYSNVVATDPWDCVRASRDPNRPGVSDVLRFAADHALRLNSSGRGSQEPGLIVALATFGGSPCVVLGHQRLADAPQPVNSSALRQAQRGMRLAVDLRVPLVSFIDTPGAELSRSAEESGLAAEIAQCITTVISLDTPTISVILGEGTGGAALALFPADRMFAAQNAWLAPLSPEGASAIVDSKRIPASTMCRRQGIASFHLFDRWIVDNVVPESPDAAAEPVDFCKRIGALVASELADPAFMENANRIATRSKRFDNFGRAR